MLPMRLLSLIYYMQQNKGCFDDETISVRYKIFARDISQNERLLAERAKEDEAAIANYHST